MKKCYCPYCGGKSLSPLKKLAGEKRGRLFGKTHWGCADCGKEAVEWMSPRVKKINTITTVLSILFALTCIVIIVIKPNDLNYFPGALALLSATVISNLIIKLIDYRYKVFVRTEQHSADDVVARAHIKINVVFAENRIYILKPSEENGSADDARPEYVVAMSNNSRKDKSCDVRFIKPREAMGSISARRFDIYDDDYRIGNCEFFEQNA
jgi:hypothetical protein